MKVYVVYEIKDNEGYAKTKILGVFSDRDAAVDYCNKLDPDEETHYCDDYEVDLLIADANTANDINTGGHDTSKGGTSENSK